MDHSTPTTADLADLIAEIDRAEQREGPSDLTPAPAPTHRSLRFAAGEVRYAVAAASVSELAVLPTVTRLPHAPGWARGLVNLRGEIIALVDLEALWGRPPLADSPDQRLVVLRATVPNGEPDELSAALLVDRVLGLTSLPEAARTPVAGLTLPGDVAHSVTTSEGAWVVLDATRLLLALRSAATAGSSVLPRKES